MSNVNQISMSPCFMTEEEFEEGYKRSIFWTESKFLQEYHKHIAAMEHIASCAKIFILKNSQKIEDWSDLEVEIEDNSGKKTVYYKFTPVKREAKTPKQHDIFERIEASRKRKHNPIVSLTDVVLDPTDGDFSLTINGRDHLWIDDGSIILIANYIEEKLNGNNG